MTAIRTLPLTPYVIDAFAARLPEGAMKNAVSEMALMTNRSLVVHNGHVEMIGDRVIMENIHQEDGQIAFDSKITHRTLSFQAKGVSLTDTLKLNGAQQGQPQTQEEPADYLDDLLYACGCFGGVPPPAMRHALTLRETLGLSRS